MTNNGTKNTVFILVDGSGAAEGLAKFAGPNEIPVEKLREHLQSFVRKIGGALEGIAGELGAYELTEVEVEAVFNAEVGFVFVAKTGVEGSVKLKFVRNAKKL